MHASVASAVLFIFLMITYGTWASAVRPPDCLATTYPTLQTIVLNPVDTNYILDLNGCTYSGGLTIDATTTAAILGVTVRVRSLSIAGTGFFSSSRLALGLGSSIRMEDVAVTGEINTTHSCANGASFNVIRTSASGIATIGGAYTSDGGIFFWSFTTSYWGFGSVLRIAAVLDTATVDIRDSYLENVNAGLGFHGLYFNSPVDTQHSRLSVVNATMKGYNALFLSGGRLGLNTTLTVRQSLITVFSSVTFLINVVAAGGTVDIDDTNQLQLGRIRIDHQASSAGSRLLLANVAVREVVWTRTAGTTGTGEMLALRSVTLPASLTISLASSASIGMKINMSRVIIAGAFTLGAAFSGASVVGIDGLAGVTTLSITGAHTAGTSITVANIAPSGTATFTNALTDSSLALVNISMGSQPLLLSGAVTQSSVLISESRALTLELRGAYVSACVSVLYSLFDAGSAVGPVFLMDSTFTQSFVDLLVQGNTFRSSEGTTSRGLYNTPATSATNSVARWVRNSFTAFHPFDRFDGAMLTNTSNYFLGNQFITTSPTNTGGSNNIGCGQTLQFDGLNNVQGAALQFQCPMNLSPGATQIRITINASRPNTLSLRAAEASIDVIQTTVLQTTETFSLRAFSLLVADSTLSAGLFLKEYSSGQPSVNTVVEVRNVRITVASSPIDVAVELRSSALIFRNVSGVNYIRLGKPFQMSTFELTNTEVAAVAVPLIVNTASVNGSTIQIRNATLGSCQFASPLAASESFSLLVTTVRCVAAPCFNIDAASVTRQVIVLWNVTFPAATGLSLAGIRDVTRLTLVNVIAPSFSITGSATNGGSSSERVAACNRNTAGGAVVPVVSVMVHDLACSAAVFADRCLGGGGSGASLVSVTASVSAPSALSCVVLPASLESSVLAQSVRYAPSVAFSCPLPVWLPRAVPEIIPTTEAPTTTPTTTTPTTTTPTTTTPTTTTPTTTTPTTTTPTTTTPTTTTPTTTTPTTTTPTTTTPTTTTPTTTTPTTTTPTTTSSPLCADTSVEAHQVLRLADLLAGPVTVALTLPLAVLQSPDPMAPPLLATPAPVTPTPLLSATWRSLAAIMTCAVVSNTTLTCRLPQQQSQPQPQPQPQPAANRAEGADSAVFAVPPAAIVPTTGCGGMAPTGAWPSVRFSITLLLDTRGAGGSDADLVAQRSAPGASHGTSGYSPVLTLLVADPSALESQALVVLLIGGCASAAVDGGTATVARHYLSPLSAVAGPEAVGLVHSLLGPVAVVIQSLYAFYARRNCSRPQSSKSNSISAHRQGSALFQSLQTGPAVALMLALYPGAAWAAAALVSELGSSPSNISNGDVALHIAALSITCLFLIALPCCLVFLHLRTTEPDPADTPHVGSTTKEAATHHSDYKTNVCTASFWFEPFEGLHPWAGPSGVAGAKSSAVFSSHSSTHGRFHVPVGDANLSNGGEEAHSSGACMVEVNNEERDEYMNKDPQRDESECMGPPEGKHRNPSALIPAAVFGVEEGGKVPSHPGEQSESSRPSAIVSLMSSVCLHGFTRRGCRLLPAVTSTVFILWCELVAAPPQADARCVTTVSTAAGLAAAAAVTTAVVRPYRIRLSNVLSVFIYLALAAAAAAHAAGIAALRDMTIVSSSLVDADTTAAQRADADRRFRAAILAKAACAVIIVVLSIFRTAHWALLLIRTARQRQQNTD